MLHCEGSSAVHVTVIKSEIQSLPKINNSDRSSLFRLYYSKPSPTFGGPAHPNPALTYPKRTAHTDNRIRTHEAGLVCVRLKN